MIDMRFKAKVRSIKPADIRPLNMAGYHEVYKEGYNNALLDAAFLLKSGYDHRRLLKWMKRKLEAAKNE